MTYKDALIQIMKICYESSEYSRRTQHIHEVAMKAVGLTSNQRAERHIKASMRSEAYKENIKKIGAKESKAIFVKDVEEETGESRPRFKSIVNRIVTC